MKALRGLFPLFCVITLPLSLCAQSYKTYAEARKAMAASCVAKDVPKAEAAYREAIRLAGKNEWQKGEVARDLVNGLFVNKKPAAALELGLPIVNSYTNLTKCPWTIRTAFATTARAALAENRPASFRLLVDRLGKEPFTKEVFDCWIHLAKALSDDAFAQRKKSPAQRTAQVEALRKGELRFGLWKEPQVVDGDVSFARHRLAEAEELLFNHLPQAELDVQQRLACAGLLLDGQTRAGDEAGKKRAFGRLSDQILGAEPRAAQETNLVNEAIDKSFRFYEDRFDWTAAIGWGDELLAKRKDFLGEEAVVLKGREMAYRFRAGEDAAYRALFDELSGMELSGPVFDAYFAASQILKRGVAWKDGRKNALLLLEPIYRRREKLDESRRWDLLNSLFDSAMAIDDLDRIQATYRELCDMAEKRDAEIEEDVRKEKEARAKKLAYVRHRLPRMVVPLGAHDRYARRMVEERLFEEARQAFVRQAEAHKRNGVPRLYLAAIDLAEGRKGECVRRMEGFATNASFRVAGQRAAARILLEGARAKDDGDFADRVRKALGAESMEARFDGCLLASDILMEVGAGPDQIGRLLSLTRIIEEMKRPEKKCVYEVGYLPGAPRSAEGAVRDGLFEKRPDGRFFYPYGVYSSFYREPNQAQLTDRDAPVLTKAPDREGQIALAYDETGVHLYIKLNDPRAAETLAGLDDGANFEISVMPGEQTGYNQVFGNSRVAKTTDINWDSPRIGRRQTYDAITTDRAVSSDHYAFHVFIPWLMYYTRLPEDGDSWRFVIGCGWDGDFRMVGGGAVHEFGRGLVARFKISPEEREKIRAHVVRQAIGEYRRVRSEWSNAGFWSDPHIGDPDFHAGVVEPLLRELDEKARRFSAGALSPQEVDRLFEEDLVKWADFRLHLDGLRDRYLEKRLFRE